jgi:hypothetical protein
MTTYLHGAGWTSGLSSILDAIARESTTPRGLAPIYEHCTVPPRLFAPALPPTPRTLRDAKRLMGG